MENKIIPTAEELMQSKNGDDYTHWEEIHDMMIEFAKLHVEAALKSACASLPYDDKMNQNILDIIAINNSYPLENIK